MTKEEILKKNYWNHCQVDVSMSVKETESPFIYNAMEEYANLRLSEQQSKHEQEMKDFAEWLDESGYSLNSNGLWEHYEINESNSGHYGMRLETKALIDEFKYYRTTNQI